MYYFFLTPLERPKWRQETSKFKDTLPKDYLKQQPTSITPNLHQPFTKKRSLLNVHSTLKAPKRVHQLSLTQNYKTKYTNM